MSRSKEEILRDIRNLEDTMRFMGNTNSIYDPSYMEIHKKNLELLELKRELEQAAKEAAEEAAKRAIFRAVNNNNIEALKTLKRQCEEADMSMEDIDVRMDNGDMPIHIAASQGYVELVDWLLDNGAEIDARGKDGNTPLQCATINNKDDMVKYLKNRGEQERKERERREEQERIWQEQRKERELREAEENKKRREENEKKWAQEAEVRRIENNKRERIRSIKTALKIALGGIVGGFIFSIIDYIVVHNTNIGDGAGTVVIFTLISMAVCGIWFFVWRSDSCGFGFLGTIFGAIAGIGLFNLFNSFPFTAAVAIGITIGALTVALKKTENRKKNIGIAVIVIASLLIFLLIDNLTANSQESSTSIQSAGAKNLIPINITAQEMYYIPVASKNGLYKYITLEGKEITGAKYIRASMFREERALVQNKDSSWGYIDIKGNNITCCYTQALSFKDGVAWVNKNGAISALDANGKTLTTLSRDIVSIWPFYDGLALYSKDGTQSYMDKNYNSVDNAFLDGNRFQENAASVMCDNGKYAYIDKDMRYITKCNFDEAKTFKNSMAIVRVGSKWGIINKSGNYVLNPSSDIEMLIQDENLFKYKQKKSNWGWLDSKGKTIIQPIYEETMNFGDRDIAPVKQNGLWGYIDKNGTYAIEPRYDAAYPFFNNRALVRFADGRFRTIDVNGNADLQTEYSKLDPSYWTLANTGVLSEPRIMTAKPSFSCDKTQSEEAKAATRMICKSENLMSLDNKMSKLYESSKSNGYAANSQKIFLAERNKCENVSCLERLYEERITELENY